MKLLLNVSIKKRLMGLFILFMLIFISVNIFSLVRLSQLGQITKEIYEDHLKVSMTALNAGMQIEKMHNIMRDVTSADSETKAGDASKKVDQLETELVKNLDAMKENMDNQEGLKLIDETKDLLEIWKSLAEQEFTLVINNNKAEASRMSRTSGEDISQKIQNKMTQLTHLAINEADTYILKSESIQTQQRIFLVIFMISCVFILFAVFLLITNSILSPLTSLKNTMNESVSTGKLIECKIEGENEIFEMSKDFNELIRMLRRQIWIKDGQNELNSVISGNLTLKELCEKAISFLSRYLECGRGGLYLFDKGSDTLYMQSSFAYTERESLSNVFMLGNGIIGQVGLEQKPILLKNIKRNEDVITTGTFSQEPLNIYALPLVFNNELYGVIELSSFELFDMSKREFLKECSNTISTILHSTMQKQKVEELLQTARKASEEAEKAKIEAQNNARELQAVNSRLEEQHMQLQQQTEEIQQANSQLEEQHQQLQHQNYQLEEQQLQLKQQAELLDTKNRNLEKIRKELDEHIKKLEASNKYKSEFLANMSHELRTPLNSIILLSKLMGRNETGNLSEKDLEKARVINESGNELLRLINDILDLSKVESGRMELDVTSFSTRELVKELCDTFNSEAREKGLEFYVHDNIEGNIKGDRNKISQIIRNFLSNAFKFTREGFVELKIEKIENTDKPVKITVNDTGIGIPEDKQDIIFEEFRQVDGSISRQYGGTGLGLSISRKMADFINGEIKVISQVNRGSQFILYLAQEATADMSDNNSIQEAAVTCDEVKTKLKRLLIIEDDNMRRDVLKEFLSADGVDIKGVAGEDEAIKELEKGIYDLVIIDLGLKRGDGISICKYTFENFPGIPIIVHTSREISIEQEYEIKKYAGSIIIKTYNSSDRLKEEVNMYLNMDRCNNTDQAYINNMLEPKRSLNLEGLKILIVDDDRKNIFVIASALENYGADIIAAHNGKEALDQLEKNKVDLVLMDIMMPVMNGFDAIKAIRNSDKLKDLPVIALTAKALKEDKEKSIEAGADDYISKPVDYDVLIRLVKAWISKNKY